MDRIISIIETVLGTLSLIYYILCGCVAGFGVSILWVWCVFGIIFLLKGSAGLYVLHSLKGKELLDRYKNRIIVYIYRTIQIVVAVMMLVFLIFQGFVISGFDETGEDKLDCIIILGASVVDGKPSDALQSRIDKAYEYLSKNKDTIVICSGGRTSKATISEAECMYNELVKYGISKDRIFLENRATTTAKNIKFSAKLIPNEAKRIGIVTNGFHVYRAVKTANTCTDNRYDICGIASPFGGIMLPHFMLREFATYVVDSCYGNI